MIDDKNNNEVSTMPSADELVHQQEFGVKFRQARESAGYSVAEVSELLKLSEEIIRALENSQVDKLPAATFTQGYIRSYARLLKLSATDIVATYNQLLPEKVELKTSRTKIPAESASGDFGFKFFSYFILIGGLLLLVLWWQQADVDWLNDAPIDNDRMQIQKPEEIINQPAIEITKTEVQEINILDEPVVEESHALPAVIKSELESKQDVASRIENRPEDIKPQDAVPAGDDILVVEAEADSWAEIEDANDNRFFFKLMKQGETQTLQGRAPFRLFLGNAPSVKLKINNIAVDISGYIKSNNIAYISVNDTASVQAAKKSRKVVSPDTSNEQTEMVDETILSDPAN
jgi:cytoskeleton protein RodZ